MNIVLWMVLLILTVFVSVFVIHFLQLRADALRRERAHQDYQERKVQEKSKRIVEGVVQCFPHAKEYLPSRFDPGTDHEGLVRAALRKVPGVLLGETQVAVGEGNIRLPVIWPSSERRKHGYFVGRTGVGKSTLLLHAIQADIDSGSGVCVIAPEHEFFRESLLPLCERRAEEVLYFAPGISDCSIRFNPHSVEPGDDTARCAGEEFAILKGLIGGEGLGVRMSPILANSLSALVCIKGTTLWDARRILEDPSFRASVLASVTDPYVRNFWTKVYPTYPKDAHIPVVNRLDELLRSPHLRRALCAPTGFSVREVLSKSRILLVDLGGLDPGSMLLIGQLVLARFQIELMRRETVPQAERSTFYLYCDEFQVFSASSEATWRELLSRGRRYGLALTLAHQFPSQIPLAVRDEILGNVATIVAFGLGAKDAEVIRKELLHDAGNGEGPRPVPLESLVNQPVGHAVTKLGSGALAVGLKAPAPIMVPPVEVGAKVRDLSWKLYGTASSESIDVVSISSRERSETVVRGRGGAEHKDLQRRIAAWGSENGFRATIERQVEGGRVDVALERAGLSIACEVSFTTPAVHELGNVRKCLAAGFDHVVLILPPERIHEAEEVIFPELGEVDMLHVHVLTPDAATSFLGGVVKEESNTGQTVAGFRVRLECRPISEADARERRHLVGIALGRAQGEEAKA